MKTNKELELTKKDIGVIVGRFQIHDLHPEHKKLIDTVINNHNKVILFLGCTPALSTKKNPLDFATRKVMVEEIYGDKLSAILPLYNHKFDDEWSRNLDKKIREVFQVGSVVLYGSKDSFIPYYKGIFDTCELVPDNFVSATDIRDEIKNKVLRSKEFRAGVIYATQNSFPKTYSTIDVAIMNEDYSKVLLGRKDYEKEFRFIGGFVDPTDETLVQTVKREAQEETGLEIDDVKYICSRKINDWRYRGEEDCSIMTHFHIAKKIFGSEKASDDIIEVKWFDLETIDKVSLVKEHQYLMSELLTFLQK